MARIFCYGARCEPKTFPLRGTRLITRRGLVASGDRPGPTEAAAETVGSNPAPATTSRRTLVVRRIFLRKMRLHRSGWSHLPVWSVLDVPHWGAAPLLPAKSLAAPALFACKRSWSPVGTVQDRPRRQPRPHDVPACYQLFADKDLSFENARKTASKGMAPLEVFLLLKYRLKCVMHSKLN